MKKLASIITTLLLLPSFLSAQYTFTAKGGKVLENKSTNKISAGSQKVQYHTLTNNGLKIETVQYGFGGAIDIVKVEEISYNNILNAVKEGLPEFKKYDYNHYFFLSPKSGSEKPVYTTSYFATSDKEISKEKSIEVYFDGNANATEDYLNSIINKAKAITSKPGYKEDKSSYAAFTELDQKEQDKKVEDALSDLDLDLTTDEEKAEKAAKNNALQAQQTTSYKPIYFKKAGEIIFSIYYDQSTASSLNTKVYRGDKAKLLFTTYNDVYKGQLSKRASFEQCSYCSIYSITDVGTRVITIKNKPNEIQYQMMNKDNDWYLIKGTRTNTEVGFNSNFEDLEICYTSNDGDIYGKCSLNIESEAKLTAKAKLWVMAMLHMAGYIADDGSFGN